MAPTKKQRKKNTASECIFCANGTSPNYKDTLVLRRFISERGKIISGKRAGVCSRHQRELATQLKRARFMALLPYTDKHAL